MTREEHRIAVAVAKARAEDAEKLAALLELVASEAHLRARKARAEAGAAMMAYLDLADTPEPEA